MPIPSPKGARHVHYLIIDWTSCTLSDRQGLYNLELTAACYSSNTCLDNIHLQGIGWVKYSPCVPVHTQTVHPWDEAHKKESIHLDHVDHLFSFRTVSIHCNSALGNHWPMLWATVRHSPVKSLGIQMLSMMVSRPLLDYLWGKTLSFWPKK